MLLCFQVTIFLCTCVVTSGSLNSRGMRKKLNVSRYFSCATNVGHCTVVSLAIQLKTTPYHVPTCFEGYKIPTAHSTWQIKKRVRRQTWSTGRRSDHGSSAEYHAKRRGESWLKQPTKAAREKGNLQRSKRLLRAALAEQVQLLWVHVLHRYWRMVWKDWG